MGDPLADPGGNPELAKCFVELGNPIAGYSPDPRSGLWAVGLSSAVLVLAFFLPLPLQIKVWSAYGVVLVLAIGISMLWPHLTSVGYRICPDGFVVMRWRKVEGFRWREIRSLRFHRTTETIGGWALAGTGGLSARIELEGSRRFDLKWLTATSMELIEIETTRAMLPRVQEELKAGRPVAFGDVEVGPEGLQHRRTLINWEEIEKVEFRHTVVVTKRDGSTVHLFDVPNLGVFMILADARLSTGRFAIPGIESARG